MGSGLVGGGGSIRSGIRNHEKPELDPPHRGWGQNFVFTGDCDRDHIRSFLKGYLEARGTLTTYLRCSFLKVELS